MRVFFIYGSGLRQGYVSILIGIVSSMLCVAIINHIQKLLT